MSSNWGFDYQRRFERRRRERQAETLDRQRTRRSVQPGLAPVDYEAAEDEAALVMQQTVRSSLRRAVLLSLGALVPYASLALVIQNLQTFSGPKASAGAFIHSILCGIGCMMLVLTAWSNLRRLNDVARWGRVPVPRSNRLAVQLLTAFAIVLATLAGAVSVWLVFLL